MKHKLIGKAKDHYSQMTKRHWYLLLIVFLSITGVLIVESVKNHVKNGRGFYKENISAELKNEMLNKNVWNINCPVAIERLRLLTIPYFNFSGQEKLDGKLIVLDVAAERTLAIFRELHRNKFPIANMKLITEYNGDDELSMEDNNTSSFNCRPITGGDQLSVHSYGLAIDINPLQNPYIDNDYEVGKHNVRVMPSAGMQYLNRTKLKPGMVENTFNDDESETVIDVFKRNGFRVWGGNWENPLDYQHFQVDREYAKKLANDLPEDAVQLFETLTKNPNPKTNTLAVDK